MKEINWRVEKIINRNNGEKKFMASLNGIDLKLPSIKDEKPLDLGEEKEEMIKQAIERAKLRKASEYGRR